MDGNVEVVKWMRRVGTGNKWHFPNKNGKRGVCGAELPKNAYHAEHPPAENRCACCQREIDRREERAATKEGAQAPSGPQYGLSIGPVKDYISTRGLTDEERQRQYFLEWLDYNCEYYTNEQLAEALKWQDGLTDEEFAVEVARLTELYLDGYPMVTEEGRRYRIEMTRITVQITNKDQPAAYVEEFTPETATIPLYELSCRFVQAANHGFGGYDNHDWKVCPNNPTTYVYIWRADHGTALMACERQYVYA